MPQSFASSEQKLALQVPAFLRPAPEPALGKELPASDYIGDEHLGIGTGVAVPAVRGLRYPQRLPQGRLELFRQLVDSCLQAIVLMPEGVADQDSRHAGVLFRDREEHGAGLLGLRN